MHIQIRAHTLMPTHTLHPLSPFPHVSRLQTPSRSSLAPR